MREAERIGGRRTAVTQAEHAGRTVRVFAPEGEDGERGDISMGGGKPNPWPFAGRYYCAGPMGPLERWYELGTVGYAPDGELWLSWERCNPPEGHLGERVNDAADPPTLPVYTEQDIADTLPGVCPL